MAATNRTITFYHRVDDPYSHLLAQVLPALAAAYDVALRHRLVPTPEAEMVPDSGRLESYGRDDCVELARHFDLEFPADAVPPPADPTARATAILAKFEDTAAFLAAVPAVGAALWRGDGDALAALEGRYGAAAADAVEATLAAGRAELAERGHYFGGMLHYGGDWFWGVDRVGWLEERLAADGLARDGAREGGPRTVLARRETPLADGDGKSAAPGTDADAGVLDFYVSFRSPYSYLAMARVLDLPRRYPVEISIKPVLPMLMRGLPVPATKVAYIMKDVFRVAQRLGVPIGNIRDPLGPGVERGMAIFSYARREGRQAEFARSFTAGVWADGLDSASDEGLQRIVERAGLDWTVARDCLGDESWRLWEERNTADLFDIGLWGVPSFKLGGYRTWGQDRLWTIEERLARTTG